MLHYTARHDTTLYYTLYYALLCSTQKLASEGQQINQQVKRLTTV